MNRDHCVFGRRRQGARVALSTISRMRQLGARLVEVEGVCSREKPSAVAQTNDDAGLAVDDLMAREPNHQSIGAQDTTPDRWKIMTFALRAPARFQELLRHFQSG
jgi:hypothetical protein